MKYKYFEEINKAILRQIPTNKSSDRNTVLDIGCGTGGLAEAIQKKGYDVWGIESNREAAQICQKRVTRLINADLTDLEFVKTKIGNQVFDCIIFADILEHLCEPLFILKYYLRFLKDNGRVLVSLPNTVVWTNRIMFLFGKFEYTDTGILDNDHLRFFTFKTAKFLIKSAGCSIIKTDYIPYFTRAAQPAIKKILLKDKKESDVDRQFFINSPLYKWYMKYIDPIEYLLGYPCKSLFAFKMIIVAKKSAQRELIYGVNK